MLLSNCPEREALVVGLSLSTLLLEVKEILP